MKIRLLRSPPILFYSVCLCWVPAPRTDVALRLARPVVDTGFALSALSLFGGTDRPFCVCVVVHLSSTTIATLPVTQHHS